MKPFWRLNVFITAMFVEHRNTAVAEKNKYSSADDTDLENSLCGYGF